MMMSLILVVVGKRASRDGIRPAWTGWRATKAPRGAFFCTRLLIALPSSRIFDAAGWKTDRIRK